ncbi:hypothetical protein LE181_02235 [Streptomyces sp. SCA3-4]|uniref:hypothetical protein n=1 Tax=Streptomyces sichuanensis TaxID=2871810 RepID=UPI001CE28E50|nr:hypothetical protein [Streptomyces sichuanensis]MCA6090993.1 hypothetical protein [Streptomyces sichuanensis]
MQNSHRVGLVGAVAGLADVVPGVADHEVDPEEAPWLLAMLRGLIVVRPGMPSSL